jgi:hypothetical protein
VYPNARGIREDILKMLSDRKECRNAKKVACDGCVSRRRPVSVAGGPLPPDASWAAIERLYGIGQDAETAATIPDELHDIRVELKRIADAAEEGLGLLRQFLAHHR